MHRFQNKPQKSIITPVWLVLFALLFVCLFVFNTQVHAIEEPTPDSATPTFPPYQLEHISTAQGLSQSSIHTILQDRHGFMWFGTLNGLLRYDGYDFVTYEHDPEDPTSLSDNMIEALYEDHMGLLWVGTSGGGLNQFERETGTFKRYEHFPEDLNSISSNNIRVIFEDSQGFLWIGTNGGGLNQFDRATDRFTRYQNDPTASDSLSNNTVTSIQEDETGQLWIGTSGGGLDRLDPQNGAFTHFRADVGDGASLPNDYVTAVYPDKLGTLWIGTQSGELAALDLDHQKFSAYQNEPDEPNNQRDDSIRAIHEDRLGNLWIGSLGDGMNYFDRETAEFHALAEQIGTNSELDNQNIRAIYADQSGIIWIGTAGGGLFKLVPTTKPFRSYQHDANDPYSLSSNIVQAIYQGRDETIWVGTKGGGLNKLDVTSQQFIRYQNNPADENSLSSNDVLAIVEELTGVFWVGTSGGLNRFNRHEGTFTRFQNDPADPNSLSSNVVLVVFEDQKRNLWVGTSAGLDKFNRFTGQFIHYLHDPDDPASLSQGQVQAIFEDSQGKLWIGTDNGLDFFDRANGQFIHYQNATNDPNSLSNNSILSIYEDSSGVLWVGSNGGGLNKFEPENETFTHFREKDGLANDTVYGILEDAQNNLWLSTNQGLVRFDPTRETFHNYDVGDGLQSNEFSANAYFLSSSGEMFFGGVNGLNSFHPQTIHDNPFAPELTLTALTQGGEALPDVQNPEMLEALVLSWPDNFFEFEVAALNFQQSHKNQYAYMLEGYDEDWQTAGAERYGRYRDIPPGKYTLRVKGSNNDGIWSEQELILPVSIEPPLWQNWWFRGLALLIVLGGVFGGYWVRVKRMESSNTELAALVTERTKVLAQRTEELEQRRQIAEGLREILIILNSDEQLEKSLDHIVTQAAVSSEAAEAIILRYEEANDFTVMAHTPGCNGEIPSLIVERMARAGQEKQPLIVSNLPLLLQALPAPLPRLADRFRALLGVPLRIDGELYGSLLLLYAEKRPFTNEEIDLGLTFADQATLAIANAQLRGRAEETAVATERNRLARDLHDAVTQTLFSASLVAEVLPATWQKSQTEGQNLLQELRSLNRGALAEMRSLLLELRPAALEEAPLDTLMRQLGEASAGRSGVAIETIIQGSCRLPANVHLTFYRIAQEALNNIVKHAEATAVQITLICSTTAQANGHRQHAVLQIHDNGHGFIVPNVPADRLGLMIMKERAQSVGATLTINSTLHAGTDICLQWKDAV